MLYSLCVDTLALGSHPQNRNKLAFFNNYHILVGISPRRDLGHRLIWEASQRGHKTNTCHHQEILNILAAICCARYGHMAAKELGFLSNTLTYNPLQSFRAAATCSADSAGKGTEAPCYKPTHHVVYMPQLAQPGAPFPQAHNHEARSGSRRESAKFLNASTNLRLAHSPEGTIRVWTGARRKISNVRPWKGTLLSTHTHETSHQAQVLLGNHRISTGHVHMSPQQDHPYAC